MRWYKVIYRDGPVLKTGEVRAKSAEDARTHFKRRFGPRSVQSVELGRAR